MKKSVLLVLVRQLVVLFFWWSVSHGQLSRIGNKDVDDFFNQNSAFPGGVDSSKESKRVPELVQTSKFTNRGQPVQLTAINQQTATRLLTASRSENVPLRLASQTPPDTSGAVQRVVSQSGRLTQRKPSVGMHIINLSRPVRPSTSRQTPPIPPPTLPRPQSPSPPPPSPSPQIQIPQRPVQQAKIHSSRFWAHHPGDRSFPMISPSDHSDTFHSHNQDASFVEGPRFTVHHPDDHRHQRPRFWAHSSEPIRHETGSLPNLREDRYVFMDSLDRGAHSFDGRSVLSPHAHVPRYFVHKPHHS